MINTIIINTNRNYYYIETIRDDNHMYHIDISIFECDEWNLLLKMSKTFEKTITDSISNDNTNYKNITNEIKDAIYFLYYSEFCKYEGFTNLSYKYGTIDVYNNWLNNKRQNKKDDENITTNEFRKWIIINYEKIKYYYFILKDFETVQSNTST